MASSATGPVRRIFAPWDDPNARPFIEFRGVSKHFGGTVAVDNVSLGIYEREFFALLGPSGCGKTTLLRMVAGFESPSSGAILLDGQDLAGIPPYRRPTNLMFQSYALFPHMTVAGNVAFGLKQDHLSRDRIAARVEEMLELVKLAPLAARKPHQLSGGQRQRVALARSLARKPKVLLLDEPLAALDRKLRENTQLELVRLQETLGLTFVIVTHDQEEAMTVADRIAVMDHGRLEQVATPTEIYEQPASRYVADFIGDINMFEGRVTGVGNGSVRLDAPAVGTIVVATSDGSLASGMTACFAVRPEKVVISLEPPPGEPVNRVTGEVWDIAYLGDVSTYHVHLATGATVKARVANRARVVARPITWDDRVWLSWSADAGVVLTR